MRLFLKIKNHLRVNINKNLQKMSILWVTTKTVCYTITKN